MSNFNNKYQKNTLSKKKTYISVIKIFILYNSNVKKQNFNIYCSW